MWSLIGSILVGAFYSLALAGIVHNEFRTNNYTKPLLKGCHFVQLKTIWGEYDYTSKGGVLCWRRSKPELLTTVRSETP